jgi:hypothetical protein
MHTELHLDVFKVCIIFKVLVVMDVCVVRALVDAVNCLVVSEFFM